MTETGGMVSAEMLAERWEEQGPSMTLAERALEDREWTYGHLVVDEAQELTPMQWRVLFRRVPWKWGSVGGDLAQASRADNAHTWSLVFTRCVVARDGVLTHICICRTPQMLVI